jgi:type IV secretory pathway TrbD component
MKATFDHELNQVPIRASLWKSVLLAGADRRVTIIIIGSCMVLVLLSRFALWPCVTAILLATAGQIIGVKLAAIDPSLIDVYLRHINFKRIYSARPDITHQEVKLLPSVPKL